MRLSPPSIVCLLIMLDLASGCPSRTSTTASPVTLEPTTTQDTAAELEPARVPAGPRDEAMARGFEQYFIPLLEGCIDDAVESNPELTGELHIHVNVVRDPDEDDTVVETVGEVELHASPVEAPELLECIRGSVSDRLKAAPNRITESWSFVFPI